MQPLVSSSASRVALPPVDDTQAHVPTAEAAPSKPVSAHHHGGGGSHGSQERQASAAGA